MGGLVEGGGGFGGIRFGVTVRVKVGVRESRVCKVTVLGV